MNWGMLFAIIGANVGLIALLASMMLWIFSKLDGDIKLLRNDISNLSTKLDAEVRSNNNRLDQLYHMFIDLLKEQKTPKTDP